MKRKLLVIINVDFEAKV